MTRHALLNNVAHKNLRVITRRDASFGDDLMAVMTFPAEFRNVQAHYPIVFHKDQNGVFTPLALFGFREKQNLFLTPGGGWEASYLPLMVERQPFLIGTGANAEQVIHIDLDSPRVSESEGELLFREHGGTSEYLEHVGSMLATIQQGIAATAPFTAALVEHNLLESFVLDISFRDGGENRFGGFYTVQEERLAKLDAATLGKLHEKGYLQAIYMIVASLANFRELVERAGRVDASAR